MAKQQTKIMYDSDEAATFKTDISGWVSSEGRFFGNNEHLARWSGSTHKKCNCGNVTEKHWTVCTHCRTARSDERYNALEFREWSGEPLSIFGCDTYFFRDEIYDYLNDLEKGAATPQLVICEPVFAPYIEDYGVDQLPDDFTIEDAHPKLAELIADVNKYVHENNPILSWCEGKFRTTVSPK